jgi:autotransporter-associated beta strand protein
MIANPTKLNRAISALIAALAIWLTAGTASAVSGNWISNAGGYWSAVANWDSGVAPGTAPGDVVTINNDITAARTVTNDMGMVTVGRLDMGDSGSPYFTFTLAASGGSGLTFDNSGSDAQLNFPVAGGTISTISVPITLNGNLGISASTANTSANVLSSNITDGAGTYGITLDSPTGTGIVQFNAANSFKGGVLVKAGRLNANILGAFGTGAVTVNSGGSLYLLAGGAYTNAFSIAGIGFTEAAGNLGAIRLANSANVSGPITLTGDARITGHGITSGALSGNIGETGGAHTLEIGNYNTTSDSTITVSGNNTYSGGTTNKGVTLTVNNSNAFGTGPVTLIGNGAATRITRFSLVNVTLTNSFVLNSTNNTSFGALTAVSGLTSVISGPITISANVGLGGHFASDAAAASLLRVTGQILSPGITPIVSVGNVELSGGGTYPSLSHGQGLLRLGANNGINSAAALNESVVNNSTFDLNGYNQSLTGLTKGVGASTVTNSSGTTSTLTLAPVAGTTNVYGGLLRGNLNLAVSSGAFYLNGVNDFTGNCSVSSGATLGGAASVAGSTTVSGGSIEGGTNGVGGLSFGKNLTFNTGTLVVSPSSAGAPVVVVGTLNTGSSTAVQVSIQNSPADGVYHIARFGTLAGTAGFALSTPNPNYTLQVSGNYLNLIVATDSDLVWKGNLSSEWSLQPGDMNWVTAVSSTATAYADSPTVFFNDTATATVVDVSVDTVAPTAMFFNNSTKNYTLQGTLAISGLGGTLTKTGNGSLTINSTNSFGGAVALNGGTVSVASVADSANNSPLGAGSSVSFAGGTLEYTGASGSMNRSVTVAADGGKVKTDNIITLSGTVSGAGTLTKAGSGTLVLSGTSSALNGGAIIESGILSMGATNTLGSSTIVLGNTNTGSAETLLQFWQPAANNSVVVSSPIVISSNAPSSTAVLEANPASLVTGLINSSVALQNRSVIITNGGAQLYNLNGQISGVGDLYLATTGFSNRFRLNFNGNSFLGNLWLTSGGVQISDGTGDKNAIPDTSDVYMTGGSVMGFGGNDTFGALNGDSGTIVGENHGTAGINLTMTVGANNHSGTFNGTIWLADVGNPTGRPNMPLSIVKIGTGTQTFNGNCSNTAPTRVGGGALIINSSYFASAVTVSNNATFGGSGTLSSNVTILAGGTLSPGASIGTLAITGNLTNAGNLYIEVDKSQPVQSNDFVNVSGVLTNSGTGIVTMTNINSNPSFAFANGDKFTLFSKPLSNGLAMTISPPSPGPGLAWTNNLAMDGSIGVYATINTTPVPITFSVSGSTLTLSWPADHLGWHLQMQTNTLGVGLKTNGWVVVPGSDQITSTNISITKTNPTVFYRITYP